MQLRILNCLIYCLPVYCHHLRVHGRHHGGPYTNEIYDPTHYRDINFYDMAQCSFGSFSYGSPVTNHKIQSLRCVPQPVIMLNLGEAILIKNIHEPFPYGFFLSYFMECFTINLLWVCQIIKSSNHVNFEIYRHICISYQDDYIITKQTHSHCLMFRESGGP